RLATEQLFGEYLKKEPPGPEKAELDSLRFHAMGLLEDVQRLRVGRQELLDIRGWHTYLMTGIVVVFLIVVASTYRNASYDTFLLALASAIFGATLSIVSR